MHEKGSEEAALPQNFNFVRSLRTHFNLRD